MARRSIHPDLTVEYLLQELELQGVDAAIIAAFASRAAKRGKGQAASRLAGTGHAVTSGECPAPEGVSHGDYAPQFRMA